MSDAEWPASQVSALISGLRSPAEGLFGVTTGTKWSQLEKPDGFSAPQSESEQQLISELSFSSAGFIMSVRGQGSCLLGDQQSDNSLLL